jgi:glycosyltransferase involved in cell wall biosynthesis
MNKKLSIIIPVFNGERYIKACLTALTAQLTQDTEIILINDGSADRTDDIVKTEFADVIQSGLLQYISTPNAGVSAARNLGLNQASGQYIAFVDADDMVTPDYVVQVMSAAQGGPCIIELGYRTTSETGEVLGDNQFLHHKFGRHPAKEVLDDVFASCIWYPFLRVFKSDMLQGVRFPVGVKFCEDLITFSDTYFKAKTIHSLPHVLYEYRINPAGATRNIKPEHAAPLVDFYKKIQRRDGFATKALKINVGYAIRRCTATPPGVFGPLPISLSIDLMKTALDPRLLWRIGFRFTVGATAGPLLDAIKRTAR